MVILIELLLMVFTLLIIARVLMSWVQMDPYHPAAQFIYNSTEPFLKPIRDLMPPAAGLDFSPIILLIGVQVIGQMFITLFV